MPNDILELFSPACQSWFTRNIGMPTPVQREGWAAIARGGNVLISAPTGTGKGAAHHHNRRPWNR